MTDRDNYKKIFDNGLLHIETAQLLANNGSFGFAISHLILGIEELIKYQVVLTHYGDKSLFTDEEINPQNRNSIFRNHHKKHDLIKEFQQAISAEFSTELLDYILHKVSGQELKEKHLEVERNRFKEWGNFFSVAYKDINIPENERQSFYEWLKNANDLKNNGLYVNLTGSHSSSPSDIRKEQYEIALKYTDAILKQAEVIKSLDLSDDEFLDILNSDAR